MDAQACRYIQEPRPLADRLNDVGTAFVGTVTNDDGGHYEFTVEQIAKGSPSSPFRVEKDDSSCAIRFHRGERWLYAGPSVTMPTVLLQDEHGRVIKQASQQQAELAQVISLYRLNITPAARTNP
jgi:hypothetical protein